MKILKYLILVLVTMSLGACSVLKKEEINPWLNSLGGTPAVNVSGIWWSGSAFAGGWGEGRFIQTGNRISGTLGFYNVDGAVAGKDIYLSLFIDKKVFYTAHLQQSGESIFMGKAVEGAIIDQQGSENALGYLMVLKKESDSIPDNRWLTREETSAWLNSLAGLSQMSITGIWDSGGAATGGWGEGRFIQTGNRVSGTLVFYNVDGAVAGTDVYLVLFTRVKIYYTVHLQQSGDGNYVGRAVHGAIVDKKGSEGAASYQVVLKKTSNTMAP